MSKKEFIQAQAASTKVLNRRMSVWLVLFMLGMIGLVPIMDYLDKRPQEFGWIARASGGAFLGFILLGFGLLAWYGIKEARKGPKCPHCSKPLQHINGKIAIATGNCAECGGKVFTD